MTEAATAHSGHARKAVPRTLLYLVAVGAVAGLVFLVVPSGGSWALAILLGGLMLLHHLPMAGHGKGHGPRRARGEADDAQDGEGGGCH